MCYSSSQVFAQYSAVHSIPVVQSLSGMPEFRTRRRLGTTIISFPVVFGVGPHALAPACHIGVRALRFFPMSGSTQRLPHIAFFQYQAPPKGSHIHPICPLQYVLVSCGRRPGDDCYPGFHRLPLLCSLTLFVVRIH